MILAVPALVLAQVAAAATPGPTPRPTTTVRPVDSSPGATKADAAPNSGIDTRKVKLNRSVSFSQDRVPVLPTPTPIPAGMTAPESSAAAVASANRIGEAQWKQRGKDARRAEETAARALELAQKSAPTCISYGPPGPDYQNCMATRYQTLTPYEVALVQAREARTAVVQDCRKDIYCIPSWLE